MKITIEPTQDQSKEKHAFDTITIESLHDDLHIDEAMSLVERALVAWGFHPDTVQDYYKDEEETI